MAHAAYVREISQKGEEIKLVMYEKAPINPVRIPQLLDVCKPSLKFTADSTSPYFTYTLNANSREKGRNVQEVLKELLEKMAFLQEK